MMSAGESSAVTSPRVTQVSCYTSLVEIATCPT
jgi:hypothetical protein